MHRAESFLPALGLPLEVPAGMSPALAGLLVGAVSGIVLFTLVMLATRRRPLAQPRYAVGCEVMHVAPYATGSGYVLPPSSSLPPPPEPRPTFDDPLARGGQHVAVATPETPPRLPPLAPHPLGVIAAGSTTLRAAIPASLAPPSAPIADDSPTVIAETLFDEPPQPRHRGAPPRIRPVAPTPPRFGGDHP